MKTGEKSADSETTVQDGATPDRDGWLTPRISFSLIAIALIAVFWRVIVGWHTFFYRDAGSLGYPVDFYQREAFFHGQLPLWNPYSHCGVPFLAQWGRWYPFSFLADVLPVAWFTNFLVIAHLFWGGAGMYWLCRRWKIGVFGASFAAIAFIFNGATLSCLTWSNYIACLAWLPWVIGCVIAAWKYGGRWIPLAALASAMQVLTATPELTFLSWLFLGALWLIAVLGRETGFFISMRRVCAVIGLAAGITMVQMLPFFDLLAHSQRNAKFTEVPWAVPAWGLANLLVPLFHCYLSPQGTMFQDGQEFMPSYYLGAGVLLLGVAGAFWNRSRRNAVILAAAVFCWIMAMGPHTIFFNWFRHCFPLVSVARFPVKFAILPAFLVPILAGGAVDQINSGARREQTRRTLILLGGLALLCMGTILWFGHSHPLADDHWNITALHALGCAGLMAALFACALLAATAKSPALRVFLQLACLAILPIDALTHTPNITPTAPASILAPGIWEAKGYSPVQLTEGRVMIDPQAEQQLIYSHVENLQIDFLVKRVGEWYNLNLLDDVPKLTGAFTLRPEAFDVLEKYLYYTEGAHYGDGLLDFLSIKWISSPNDPTEWKARTNSLPLITGGQRPLFVPEDKLLSAIASDTFNPRQEIYFPESAKDRITISNQTQCAIQNVRFTSGKIEASVQCADPAIVVLSETYYHRWHAFVDDKPTELFRANLAFQAVQVPAGNHNLKIVYTDPNLTLGATLSVLSIAACALFWRRTKTTPWETSSFGG